MWYEELFSDQESAEERLEFLTWALDAYLSLDPQVVAQQTQYPAFRKGIHLIDLVPRLGGLMEDWACGNGEYPEGDYWRSAVEERREELKSFRYFKQRTEEKNLVDFQVSQRIVLGSSSNGGADMQESITVVKLFLQQAYDGVVVEEVIEMTRKDLALFKKILEASLL